MARFPTDFTAKTTPVGADKLLLADSAASDANKSTQINQLLGALYGPQ